VPTEAERCSALSERLGEALVGTASTVANWILLEHPGPWGPDALRASRLPAGSGLRLRMLAAALHVRIVLIRRHRGGSGKRDVRCFLAHTGPDRPWLERLALSGLGDLFDLELSPMASGAAPKAGVPDERPLYVVCTHGRRDPCCAERGRPLARALNHEYGARVWESSHIGGDRFAANLVCFPHGIYLGRLEPEPGIAAAREYERGRIDLEHYRGRSCYAFAVQAAETLIRRREGLTGLDDLRLIRTERPAPDVVTATFEGPGRRMLARSVRVGRAEPARPLTCHGTEPVEPPTYSDLGS
jgi:sucrase/ferredoxin-like protein